MSEVFENMATRISSGIQILFVALLAWAGITLVNLNSQIAVVNSLLETQGQIITEMRSDMRSTYARNDRVSQLESRVTTLEGKIR
ncbi:hypothetical protein ACUN9V_05705 [Salinicola sp. V024]|uniref:hypothetical protein n=1 Tax=Salinicola sp. V024 TaxID=3459609 RepID=UPI004043950E